MNTTLRSQEDFLAAVGRVIDEVVDHELLVRNVTVQGGPVHNKRRQLAKILYEEYMQNIPPAIAPQNLSNDLICCGNFISRCQVDLVHIDNTVREKAMCTLKHLQYKNLAHHMHITDRYGQLSTSIDTPAHGNK